VLTCDDAISILRPFDCTPLSRHGHCRGEQTGGSSGRNDGTVKAGFGDDVNLDGRVTARVVHRTSVDLGDRHSDKVTGDQ